MPNLDNINDPITMIAHGRSGTSLCMSILRAHPDVTTVGETASMLFGAFHSMERVGGTIRPDPELGGREAHNARCGKAVRAMYLASFPDDSPRWMQKPINVPFITHVLPGMRRFRQKADWYWNALHTTFPGSTNVTILRHPYDVVLSAAEYWKVPQLRAWKGIVNMARILNHPASNVDFAVVHARLVDDSKTEVARFLDHLNLSHHPKCFAATDKVYVPQRKTNRVPKSDMPEHVVRGFSRRDSWSRLQMSDFRNREREVIAAMWARFGETLEF